MDQNRSSDSSGSQQQQQQQNVHLHMHQVVCGCHGSLFPTPAAYYQPVSYRSPPPPMVTYNPPQINRPYLHHYQYTQYNQYSLPLTQMASGSSTALYAPPAPQTTTTTAHGQQNEILMVNGGTRERRERHEQHEDVMLEAEKPSETSGYDYGHVSPPPTRDLLKTNSDEQNSENFVKFLERSCITAEQIAHRNRNRPCFRNIQNLCLRTRTEIQKPCTTVSNIHSQGVPWATKDFIYAFVRLTNCWHILRGYWENRDGPAIGKITKELTPEFRECYVRWEKETVELAAQLTKIFYNLDTNANSPLGAASVHVANNLIPTQVNMMMNNSDYAKTTSVETQSSATSGTPVPSPPKGTTRGMIHIRSPTETTDQGNQVTLKDLCGKLSDTVDNNNLIIDSNNKEEGAIKIYMKPGSYEVPKKSSTNDSTLNNNGSPRAIEFLETAQNVEKVMETNNDRYWSLCSTSKIIAKPVKEEVEIPQFNVQKWLINSHFSDYENGSTRSSSPPPATGPNTSNGFYLMNSPRVSYSEMAMRQQHQTDLQQDLSPRKPPTYTLLQRDNNKNQQQIGSGVVKSYTNGRTGCDLGLGYRKRADLKKSSTATFEDKMGGGLTDITVDIFEKTIADLKTTEFAAYVAQVKQITFKEDPLSLINLETILCKLKSKQYKYVNEVVRDLYFVVNWTTVYFGHYLDMDTKMKTFIRRIQVTLETRFSHFDFSGINGMKDEMVGPLKLKFSKLDGDGDHLN